MQLQEKKQAEENNLETLKGRYESEKNHLFASSENILHEVQDLALREDDLLAQHKLNSEKKKAEWNVVLDKLNNHTTEIEEAWHDLEENEARVKTKLQKG